MNRERLAKYDEWIKELESRQKNQADKRTLYIRFFTGFVSTLGFAWGTWPGVAAVFTGLMMSAVWVLRRDVSRAAVRSRDRANTEGSGAASLTARLANRRAHRRSFAS
jgi:hypothetical protein